MPVTLLRAALASLLTTSVLGATVELIGEDSLLTMGGGNGASTCTLGVTVDELTGVKGLHVPCVLRTPSATIGTLSVEGAITHFETALNAAEKRLDAADARMACHEGFECVSSGSHLQPRACNGTTQFQSRKSFPSTGFQPCQTCSQATTCVNGMVCKEGYVNDGTNRGCACRDPAQGASHGKMRWIADAKWVVPEGVEEVLLTMVGGGGGGAGRTYCGPNGGGGGAGASFVNATVAVYPHQQITIAVGQGGLRGGTGHQGYGGAGNASTFGSCVAGGGKGAPNLVDSRRVPSNGKGGAGGIASGCLGGTPGQSAQNLHLTATGTFGGGPAGPTCCDHKQGNPGASSPFGTGGLRSNGCNCGGCWASGGKDAGGVATSGVCQGGDASGPGAGGAGGAEGCAGGSGAAGFVEVTWKWPAAPKCALCPKGFACPHEGARRACDGPNEYQDEEGQTTCKVCDAVATCGTGLECALGYENDGTNRGCKCVASSSPGHAEWKPGFHATWLVPKAVTSVTLTMVGGGGGGAGRTYCGGDQGGGGGGAGSFDKATVAVTPGQKIAVTVGMGGQGGGPGRQGPGTDGGDSSFGLCAARGGKGAPTVVGGGGAGGAGGHVDGCAGGVAGTSATDKNLRALGNFGGGPSGGKCCTQRQGNAGGKSALAAGGFRSNGCNCDSCWAGGPKEVDGEHTTGSCEGGHGEKGSGGGGGAEGCPGGTGGDGIVSIVWTPPPAVCRSPPAPAPALVSHGMSAHLDPDVMPLEHCHGDCDHDGHCKTGFVCHHQNEENPIPGCEGTAEEAMDYCVRAPAASITITPHPTPEPIRR